MTDEQTPAEHAAEETREAEEAAAHATEEAEEAAAAVAAAEEPADKVRRGRGNLEADVKAICDAYAKGEITLAEGEYLTPHRIAKLIGSHLHSEGKVSTGAVAAALHRWVDYGYIVANEKQPFAFLDFTDAARTEGLAALKAKFRADKKAEKEAANPPAATPESPAPAPEAPAPEAPEAPAPEPSAPPEAPPVAEPVPVLDEPDPDNPPEGVVPF